MTNKEWMIKQIVNENPVALDRFARSGFPCGDCPLEHTECNYEGCGKQFVKWLREERKEK